MKKSKFSYMSPADAKITERIEKVTQKPEPRKERELSAREKFKASMKK